MTHKQKNILVGSIGVVAIVLVAWYAWCAIKEKRNYGHLNATFTIEGKEVALKNGEAVVGEGASSPTVRYFGNELHKDLNGDGKDDITFLLTVTGAGTGVFYYLVPAIATKTGYEGGVAYFIGDRIAPMQTEDGGDSVILTYADRKPDEPFTTPPSEAKSVELVFDTKTESFFPKGRVGSIIGKTWVWKQAEYNDGTVLTPNKVSAFTLTFSDKGTVSITTDCNSGYGAYQEREEGFSFNTIATTKMACEGSQETVFYGFLRDTSDYIITDDGALVLLLKFDSGSVRFE